MLVSPGTLQDKLFITWSALPHNRFEEVEGVYLVGGGTHPGSGLPTIFESAKISVGLIQEDDAKKQTARPLIKKGKEAGQWT